MSTKSVSTSFSPLKKEIDYLYSTALIITFITTILSVAGLLLQNTIYPTQELREAFLANDVVTLFIGVPILLLSTWQSKKEKLFGLLLLPGAFFFMFYNYLVYLIAMPRNWFYMFYLAIVILSLYGLVNLLPTFQKETIKEHLADHVKERLGGGVLAALGLIFLARAASILFNALLGKNIIPITELALNITDLIVSPVWIFCGVLLWQRKAIGYLTGLGMLFQGSMLFIGLIILMLIQPLLVGITFPVIDIIIVLVMGMICFIPFALFLRGIQRKN